METSSVVRYLEAYTFNAFFGQTQTLNLVGYQGRSPCVVRGLENRYGSRGPFFGVIDLIETKMRNRYGSCGAGCY